MTEPWRTAHDPLIATIGPEGCVVGPIKLFGHGRTILEIPANVEYPAGCRDRK